MKRFENQVAVLSGGADGLGKGIAARIASEGCNVVLFDINEKLLQQTDCVHAKLSNVNSHNVWLVRITFQSSHRQAEIFSAVFFLKTPPPFSI